MMFVVYSTMRTEVLMDCIFILSGGPTHGYPIPPEMLIWPACQANLGV